MAIQDELRQAIVAGRLRPNEHLVELDLVREFGVGRAAIRTALARLEQEGLVEHRAHRGARVRLIDEKEAVEILEARGVLEGLAARYAAVRSTPSDLIALRKTLGRMRRLLNIGDLIAASDENAHLHGQIADIARHLTAARLIATLQSQLVRFQYRTILLPGRKDRSYAEHETIVEAIAGHDADRAEIAMRRHLRHVAGAIRL